MPSYPITSQHHLEYGDTPEHLYFNYQKKFQDDATNITNNEQEFYRRSLESNLKSDVVTASIRILTRKMRSNGPSAKAQSELK